MAFVEGEGEVAAVELGALKMSFQNITDRVYEGGRNSSDNVGNVTLVAEGR